MARSQSNPRAAAFSVTRHARERAPLPRFLRLDRLPVAHDVGGASHLDIAEHMGVATDHLGVNAAAHVVDVEQAPLGGDLGREDDLEEEVAELAGEYRAVGVGDRVHDLVRLFDDVGLQALQRLLAVPGATVGRPQAGGKRAQR
jgi:hypothetical protein